MNFETILEDDIVNGKMTVHITTNIEEYGEINIENACSTFAAMTRQYYLELGRSINKAKQKQ